MYRFACGIDLGDRYVVTGGWDGSTQQTQTVAQYTVTGDVTYLAPLQTRRYGHACSKFLDDDGQLVSISYRELGPFYINPTSVRLK